MCFLGLSYTDRLISEKNERGVNGVSSTLNESSTRIVGILQPNFYDKQKGMPWISGRI